MAPQGPRGAGCGLWVAAQGVTSTAHFDSFDNLFLVLSGSKRIRLSPPHHAASLGCRPMTHPSARQLRMGLDEVGLAAVGEPRIRVVEAHLEPGEAVYIPAGWVHELTASAASVALSLKSLPHEYYDFNRWATGANRQEQLLPFLSSTPVGGQWTKQLMAAALARFVPTLVGTLALDASPLHDLRDSYGNATRLEAGLTGGFLWDGFCEGEAVPVDDEVIATAVAQVSARLLTYRAAVRAHYVGAYLENVLAMIGVGASLEAKLSSMLSFLEGCLLCERCSTRALRISPVHIPLNIPSP